MTLCYKRRRCCRRTLRLSVLCCLLVTVVFTLTVIYFIVYSRSLNCLPTEAEDAIAVICTLHKRKQAFGNMCQSLCLNHDLKLLNCVPHHSGKEVVFIASWNEEQVVVKASHLHRHRYDYIHWTNDQGQKIYPDLETFLEMVTQSVEKNLDIPIPLNHREGVRLIGKLWCYNHTYLMQLPPKQRNEAMNNLWHLVQQPEYLLTKFFESKEIFPRVKGTCGHMYAVEYVEPLENYFTVFYPSWHWEFKIRARWSVEIVKLLRRLEMAFHQTLHICDVKVGHFGFNDKEEIRLLDLDMTFFEAVLKKNLQLTGTCVNDEDCSFIDCKGQCDNIKQKCLPYVANDNYQRVCKNIFDGYVFKGVFGLLSSPPAYVARELRTLLTACSTEKSYKIEKLQKLLEMITK